MIPSAVMVSSYSPSFMSACPASPLVQQEQCNSFEGRCTDNILSMPYMCVCVDLMAYPTHGVRESQMPNTSLTSVKMGDRGATHGKVTHKSCSEFHLDASKRGAAMCLSEKGKREHICGKKRKRNNLMS